MLLNVPQTTHLDIHIGPPAYQGPYLKVSTPVLHVDTRHGKTNAQVNILWDGLVHLGLELR